MGKVEIKQRFDDGYSVTYYLPETEPIKGKSFIATALIADEFGNRGYCSISDNTADVINGVFLENYMFAKCLLECIELGTRSFTFFGQRYIVLKSYTDHLLQKKTVRPLQKWNDVLEYLKNERQVKYLCHFTPVQNLCGISQYGIVPRDALTKEMNATLVDEERLDRKTDCSCFTFSYPNYKMMFKKRSENKIEFAVLMINIDVLRNFDAREVFFYYTNAANSRFDGVDDGLYTGLNAAKVLFYEDRNDFPSNYTFDPQAEIMIRGIIPVDYIKEVHIDDTLANRAFVKIPDNLRKKVIYSHEYFYPRKDYQMWSRKDTEWQDDLFFC